MKILRKIIYFLLLLPMATTAQNNNSNLLHIVEFPIKQGHNAQFAESVKLFKECYLKNNGTTHWQIWHRIQGKGDVYVLTGNWANWTDMFQKDPASSACHNILEDFTFPNEESAESNFAKSMPEFSRPFMDSSKLIRVTFFKVKNSEDFLEVVKGISSAIKATEGNYRGYWYQVMGGSAETPDYFVTQPYNGFADLDKEEASIWKVYEKVNGKKAADALRAKALSAIDKIWSYMYTLNQDLSN